MAHAESLENWLWDNYVATQVYNTVMHKAISFDAVQFDNLCNYWINPDMTSSLFDEIDNYVNTMIYFPCDLEQGTVTPHDFSFGYKSASYLVGNYKPVYGGQHIKGMHTQAIDKIYNLGAIKYEPYFGNFADYNGYTILKLWLPYLGFVSINPNDVIDKYIRVRLKIDPYSGKGVYFICVENELNSNDIFASPVATARILGMYEAQIGQELPKGKSTAAEARRNAIMLGLKVASATVGVATSGIAPDYINLKSQEKTLTRRNPASGRQITLGTSSDKTTTESFHTTENVDVFKVAGEALNLMHASPNVENANGVFNLINSCQSIYLVRYRPRYVSVSSAYNHLYGKPNGTVKKLGQLWGYTEISAVHIEGSGLATITENERTMIERAITNGIILPEITFTLNNVDFISGAKCRWDDWIDNGGDNTTTFKDYNFTYDAGGVYCEISNVDYIIKKNDNPVMLDDYIETGEYQIVAATPPEEIEE